MRIEFPSETPVYFIFCYARSGGTLLNRCLANIENLIVLSEVHPLNDSYDRGTESVSIAWQVQKWYGMKLQTTGYLNQIKELKALCDKDGKYLVIRDWSFIDFTPSAMNDYSPEKKSLSYQILKDNFNVNKVAFVRNAIDVALSQGEKYDVFSSSYLDYIMFILRNNVEIFKYENFCEAPDEVFRAVGESLNIPKSSNWSVSANSTRVIGDTSPSRGNVKNCVVKVPRKYVFPWGVSKINRNKKIYQANEVLGYSLGYEAEERESMLDRLFFLINKGKRLLKFK